jgi:hypothetical protein
MPRTAGRSAVRKKAGEKQPAFFLAGLRAHRTRQKSGLLFFAFFSSGKF